MGISIKEQQQHLQQVLQSLKLQPLFIYVDIPLQQQLH